MRIGGLVNGAWRYMKHASGRSGQKIGKTGLPDNISAL